MLPCRILFFQAEDGIRDYKVTGVQTCALPISAEAERWAEVIDRWQDQDAAQPADPYTTALAAMTKALMCRHGVEQMRADADEAVQTFAAAGLAFAGAFLTRGVAQNLSGDLDGGDAFFEQAI